MPFTQPNRRALGRAGTYRAIDGLVLLAHVKRAASRSPGFSDLLHRFPCPPLLRPGHRAKQDSMGHFIHQRLFSLVVVQADRGASAVQKTERLRLPPDLSFQKSGESLPLFLRLGHAHIVQLSKASPICLLRLKLDRDIYIAQLPKTITRVTLARKSLSLFKRSTARPVPGAASKSLRRSPA
jgi:hypothetical protein